MNELAGKHCKPCEGGVEPLGGESVAGLMSLLNDGWQLDIQSGRIRREFTFPAFSRTIAFVNAVAWVATIEGHHPQMVVEYGSCAVIYTTNAINGLSDNDFICAAKVDRLFEGH